MEGVLEGVPVGVLERVLEGLVKVLNVLEGAVELLEAYEDGLGVDEPMSSLGGSLCPMRQTGGCQTRGDVSNPRHIQALSLVQRNVCVETKYYRPLTSEIGEKTCHIALTMQKNAFNASSKVPICNALCQGPTLNMWPPQTV